MSLLGPGLSPRLKGFPHRKPPALLPFSPGLVGAEWAWFWDGTAAHILYYNAPSRFDPNSLLRRVTFSGTDANLQSVTTQFGVAADHNGSIDLQCIINATDWDARFKPGTGGFTVVAWVNPIAGAGAISIGSRRAAFQDKHIEMRANHPSSGILTFFADDVGNGGTAGTAVSSAGVVDGDYHIFIARRTAAGACSIWVDGIDKTSSSVSTTDDLDSATADFGLNCLPDSGTLNYFEHRILDIWVNRAWTDIEIQRYVQDPFGPFRTGVRPLFISAASPVVHTPPRLIVEQIITTA